MYIYYNLYRIYKYSESHMLLIDMALDYVLWYIIIMIMYAVIPRKFKNIYLNVGWL